ncbi:putative phosphatase regulatory subunit-domain-containing protein [Cokeromyces recurvatus]|uniref:putative phosphatase regulatory subunit-domain-containing protein n=1 Tax=Cokeromyces recurvatus TaxID=90255 RepID=UPI00221EA7D6|nr:putative phosphatase regulatory subunit-domain-containing protein [Cokeromyces recurvatus]KAI7898650.1 putative phosphatase regulatory subunit-domain-containing protein [Cokeromyces recurvatus]
MIHTNKKRVTLKKRTSIENPTLEQPNEYTCQLVAHALSLPKDDLILTTSNEQQQKSFHLHSSPLLKSSLKTPRSASAPCSPTTGIKSVHFNNKNLEDICLFRKAQTPLSVRRKSIFWANESDESDDDEEEDEERFETSLVFANWPTRLADIIDRKNKVIRVDKNLIKLDHQNSITGKISVRNLSYQKRVTIRYSFDFWKTTHNKEAIFYESHKAYDIFTFDIDIPNNTTTTATTTTTTTTATATTTTTTTLYFAVNYKVGSEEFWDNNDGRNYELKINRKLKKKNNEFTTEDNNYKLLKSRYDFSQSFQQSSQSSTTIPILSPSPLTTSRYNNTVIKPASIPTSNPFSCHSPLTTTTTTTTSTSPSLADLNSQSYMELVNKYCFYSTSPSRSPMSINI